MDSVKRILKAREYLAATLGRPVDHAELDSMCGWVGDDHRRVADFEAGRRTPTGAELMAIARATGVRVEWLNAEQGYMHDHHAAVACCITDRHGARDGERTDLMAVSVPLKTLLTELRRQEKRGELNQEQIQKLRDLLGTFSSEKGRV